MVHELTKMADSVFSQKDVRQLIKLWETEESLWKVSSDGYYRKEVRQKALENVKSRMNKGFTVSQLAEKMRNLRCYYSRELGKSRRKKSGAGAEETYVSKWTYFTTLDSFLRDQVVPRQSTSTLDITAQSSISDDDLELTDESQESTSTSSRPSTKRRRKALTDVMEKAVSVLQDKASQPREVQRDDEDIVYGQFVATEIKKIKDERTKSLLKLKIQSLIHEAQFPPVEAASSCQPYVSDYEDKKPVLYVI